jgi:hypothetical protein
MPGRPEVAARSSATSTATTTHTESTGVLAANPSNHYELPELATVHLDIATAECKGRALLTAFSRADSGIASYDRAMGFRGRNDWRDMSDHVVHFTKPRPGDAPSDDGYSPMLSILWEGALRRGSEPYGAARRIATLGDSQRVVCFSETPLDQLERLVERRSRYGIGFRKEVLVAKGGGPLWYLDQGGPHYVAVNDIINAKVIAGLDPTDPFWKLTPLIDQPGVYNGRPYRWEWEREWRVAADVFFAPEEVAFLLIPEEHHEAARQFFADAKAANSGLAYECPIIDAAWSIDLVEQAFGTNI